ncbi:MAG: hypothetical protein HYV96_10605 [Opitutae bacterium]|nr:hypothetical protein [Opitutae bacterium]
MKLLAQHGFQNGDKVRDGLRNGSLDGVILSPRDLPLEKLAGRLAEFAGESAEAERLFDPQYYACFLAGNPDSRLGSLLEDYGRHYLTPRRRSQLESESRVRDDLARALTFQAGHDLTGLIAPNIVIPGSCNSVEAVIAKHFIRHAKSVAMQEGFTPPVYATLALSRDALLDRAELVEFLEDITALDNPPDGFYLLVAVNQADARAEVYHTDVVAGWMLLNHTLAVNGFRVINGYADLASPFLGVAGAYAGATGWWANLRAFSLNRFNPEPSRGRQPLTRYLSCALLNRLTAFEVDALRTAVPEILNDLPSDELFVDADQAGRHAEALQTWEALQHLHASLVREDIHEGLARCRQALLRAQEVYGLIAERSPLRLDSKSDGRHLAGLGEGLDLFVELAELR